MQTQKKNAIAKANIKTIGRRRAKHRETREAAIKPNEEKVIKGIQHLHTQHLNLLPNSNNKCIEKKVRAPVEKIMANNGIVAISSAMNRPNPVMIPIIMLNITNHLHLIQPLKKFFILKISPNFYIVFENSSRRLILNKAKEKTALFHKI